MLGEGGYLGNADILAGENFLVGGDILGGGDVSVGEEFSGGGDILACVGFLSCENF